MFGFFKRTNSQTANFNGVEMSVSKVVPRIKNDIYKNTLTSKSDAELVTKLVGDLYVTYAIEHCNTFAMLTSEDLKRLNISKEELPEISLKNFREMVPEVKLQKYGAFYDVQTGQNFEACMLLDQKFWNREAEELTGKLIASAPHRDHMMFCDGSDKDALIGLNEFTEKFYHQYSDNHSLSLGLFEWTSTGWKIFKQ